MSGAAPPLALGDRESSAIRSARFRASREADWRRLEEILAEVERGGVGALSFAEARDLAGLYREAATALSVAREISLDRALLDYLEALAARAYLAVYAPQDRLGGLLRRFFFESAPAAVRRSAGAILLGVLILGLGALTGFLLYGESTDWYRVFMPPGMADVRHPGASTETLRDVIYGGGGDAWDELGAFAAFLFSNNARIAIFAFALGAFAGVPTVLLVFFNGLTLGVFIGLHVERGLGPDIFGWLSIHGVLELGAICVATGAGLLLARGTLLPGRRSRADALRDEGRDAVKLAILAAAMLVLAAVLEGFGRQWIQSTDWRLAIGWGSGALWLLWAARSGRGAERAR